MQSAAKPSSSSQPISQDDSSQENINKDAKHTPIPPPPLLSERQEFYSPLANPFHDPYASNTGGVPQGISPASIANSTGPASIEYNHHTPHHWTTPVTRVDGAFGDSTPHYNSSNASAGITSNSAGFVEGPFGYTSPERPDKFVWRETRPAYPQWDEYEERIRIRDMKGPISVGFNARIEKGFFYSAERVWTCYRRNYFCVRTEVSFPRAMEPLMFTGSPNQLDVVRIRSLAVSLSALADGVGSKQIELIQHTIKRNGRPQQSQVQKCEIWREPDTISLEHPRVEWYPFPQVQDGEQSLSASDIVKTKTVFEGIQFKSATANNGKRRAQQQYYHLVAELYANTSSNEFPRWVLIGTQRSCELVVRGRSPSHYQNEGLDFHLPSLPSNPSTLLAAGTRSGYQRELRYTDNSLAPSDQSSEAYTHAQYPKIPSPQCNEYPNEFRDEHELLWHQYQYHASVDCTTTEAQEQNATLTLNDKESSDGNQPSQLEKINEEHYGSSVSSHGDTGLFSGSTKSSMSSMPSNRISFDEQFVEFLTEDRGLKALFEDAFTNLAVDRFEQDFRRLLKRYAISFRKNSNELISLSVAKFIRNNSRNIASLVRRKFEVQPAVLLNVDSLQELDRSKRDEDSIINRYLQTETEFSVGISELNYHFAKPLEDQSESDDDSANSDGNEDNPSMNYITVLRVNENGFEDLREGLQDIVVPEMVSHTFQRKALKGISSTNRIVEQTRLSAMITSNTLRLLDGDSTKAYQAILADLCFEANVWNLRPRIPETVLRAFEEIGPLLRHCEHYLKPSIYRMFEQRYSHTDRPTTESRYPAGYNIDGNFMPVQGVFDTVHAVTQTLKSIHLPPKRTNSVEHMSSQQYSYKQLRRVTSCPGRFSRLSDKERLVTRSITGPVVDVIQRHLFTLQNLFMPSISSALKTNSRDKGPPRQSTIQQNRPRLQTLSREFMLQIASSICDFCQLSWHFLRPFRILPAKVRAGIRQFLRPKVPVGYRRLEWKCHCGVDLYADFNNKDEAAIQHLAEQLATLSPTTHTSIVGDQVSTSNPLPPSTNNGPESRTPQNDPTQSDTNSHVSNNCLTTAQDTVRWLALCTNTGGIYVTLSEIDTSGCSDTKLFLRMKEAYGKSRGFRKRFAFLIKPVNVEYVLFNLWNLRNGYVSICDRPKCIPPNDDIAYEYDPKPLVPLPPMPPEVFIHYLEHGPEELSSTKSIWTPRLPKRVDKRVVDCDVPTYGWGVHIVEGPNREVVFLIIIITVLASVIIGTAWSASHKDLQGGMGLGALIMALPSILMAAFLFRLERK